MSESGYTMRAIFYGLLLLAGYIAALRDVEVPVGESYAFTVIAFPNDVASCHLKTPHNEVMDFIQDQPHPYDDRFTLMPSGTLASCSITVTNLSHRDAGVWEVSYKSADGSTHSEQINLIVSGDEIEPEHDDGIIWLNTINFPTRIGQLIDISLSKIEQNEDCYVIKPEGESITLAEVKAEEKEMNGFVVHDSSQFISCRITIGSMTEDLLGDWSLCGKHKNNDEEITRCQLVKITWQNENRPNLEWGTTIHPKFDHPVHFGGSLSPTVIGTGEVISCHIITPQGEDLVIDQESEYPHLKLEPSNNKESPVCSISISEIQDGFLGDWTVYGKFNSPVLGFNEVRLPISLFLYDEDNPYNQAYNVSNEEVTRVVNLGGLLNIDVFATSGTTDGCEFIAPSGQSYNLNTQNSFEGASFVSDSTPALCSLSIGPFTEELLGKWNLIGKFSDNGRFIEKRLTATILLQDPSNPIEEDDRVVENLTEQRFDTEIGKEHRIAINTDVFTNPESCHIRTPDGLQHKFIDGFNVPGVEIIHETGVECGVIVTVKSEDNVGEWTLIARATRHSERIERRLPFTIYVEEFVEAIPQQVNVNAGENLTVRLREPTALYSTCKLKAPNDVVFKYEKDLTDVYSCTFKLFDLDSSHKGTWEIVYGTSIIYRAPIEVNVAEPTNVETGTTHTVNLVGGDAVDIEVGPDNVFYCKLENPQGFTAFDGFGKCQLTLSRVSSEHNGVWKMYLGFSGRVAAEVQNLLVNVNNRASKAVVTTSVEKHDVSRAVTVVCQLQSTEQVKGCKFRAPGRIFLATGTHVETVTDEAGEEHRYESSLVGNTCSIHLVNPHVNELGLWRCAMETEQDVYYAFMEVLCPFAMSIPAVAAQVEQEAVLRLDHSSTLDVVENEPVTMSCSINAPIKYCYFRRQNGTTFAVYPGMKTESSEYVGLGFDAGECGLRFNSLQKGDSGTWTCLVGLADHSTEQREQFTLSVNDQFHVELERNDPVLVVRGQVHNNLPLDYCRFVRIDAYGFSTFNMPPEYPFVGSLARGECRLHISNPTILEVHPWTIVAKITGQDGEISRQTGGAFNLPTESTTTTTSPPEVGDNQLNYNNGASGFQVFLYVTLSLILVSMILGLALTPKRHRQWVSARATAVRTSLRKAPVESTSGDHPQPPPYVQTA